jgi:hypothetical protein
MILACQLDRSSDEISDGITDEIKWWDGEDCELTLGEYVGQGRYLRNAGGGDYLMSQVSLFLNGKCQARDDGLEASVTSGPVELRQSDCSPTRIGACSLIKMHNEVRKHRPYWRRCWIAGQVIISTAISMAFMVAFNTPTIGFGCRSFSYTIQWAMSTVSWLMIGWTSRPTEWQRCISLLINTLSACFFLLLMVFQVGLR